MLVRPRGDRVFLLYVSPRSPGTFSDRELPVNALDRTLLAAAVRDIRQRVYYCWEPALDEIGDFKAKPPVGIDPIGASSEGASIYELIREDIIEGRLAANERLVVTDLARRHGTSTNPVREALQLLRGRGFRHLRPQPRGARQAHRSGFCPRYLRDRCSHRAGPDAMVREYGDQRGHRRTRTSSRA